MSTSYIPVCTLDSTTFTVHAPATTFRSLLFNPLRTLPFSCTQPNPFSFVAYALFAKDTEGDPCSSRTSQAATALPPFCPELSTPHGELLLAPSCNSLVSATYKLPPRKSFACGSYKKRGEWPSLAATHLDISYNLRFALLALANSEVSG